MLPTILNIIFFGGYAWNHFEPSRLVADATAIVAGIIAVIIFIDLLRK